MHMYMYTRVVTAYRKWIKDIEELQTVKVNIPLVSDVDCTVLKKVSE
jgi:alkyl hydroperoxide reductase subunit AhpC